MDWQKCMNQALGYIEDNLSDEIDYNVAAQFVNCSVWEFRRVFSFMAQIPLSEYIRRRRLTLAAADIQNKRGKIIDIALRYGYESQAAFSRAFTQLHGVSPSSARDDGVNLKAFPRLTFKFILKGVEAMDYRIEKKQAFDIIWFTRKTTEENNHQYHDIWQFLIDFFKDDCAMWRILEKYSLYPTGNDPNGISPDRIYSYSVSSYDNNESIRGGSFYYTIGVPYNGKDYSKDKELQLIHIPSASYAVFVKTNDNEDIGVFTERIFREWLPASGYKLTGTPEIELTSSKTDGIIWLPVKK